MAVVDSYAHDKLYINYISDNKQGLYFNCKIILTWVNKQYKQRLYIVVWKSLRKYEGLTIYYDLSQHIKMKYHTCDIFEFSHHSLCDFNSVNP